jgi:tetratricopeptide (TPR) repeat protein
MATQGRFAEARAVLDEASRRFPDHPVIGLTRIYIAAAESDWTRAEEYARRRLESVTASVQRIDALQTLGQIELLTGQISAARRHLEESMRLAQIESSPRKYLWSAIVLSWLDLRYRDRPDEARRRILHALSVYPMSNTAAGNVPVVQLASLYAALGMRDKVLAMEGIDINREGGEHLRGVKRAVAEQWREAALSFDSAAAPSSECPICALPELSEAEERAGDIDAAIAAADRYVRTPFIHRFEPDAPHLATTLLRLGRLHERTSQPKRAAEAYQRLLNTWGKADPELEPQVAALRARVAKLNVK